MARYRSCPAVSQICALITWPDSVVIVLVANSTPIVVLDSRENSFLEKRVNRLVLPTPESPTSTILNSISYCSA